MSVQQISIRLTAIIALAREEIVGMRCQRSKHVREVSPVQHTEHAVGFQHSSVPATMVGQVKILKFFVRKTIAQLV